MFGAGLIPLFVFAYLGAFQFSNWGPVPAGLMPLVGLPDDISSEARSLQGDAIRAEVRGDG